MHLVQVQNLQSLRTLNFSNKIVSMQANLIPSTELSTPPLQLWTWLLRNEQTQTATQTHNNHDPWVYQKITGQCRNVREK